MHILYTFLNRALIPHSKSEADFTTNTTPSLPHSLMATAVQKNLIDKNTEYAAAFTEGDLALPPAKSYAVGE